MNIRRGSQSWGEIVYTFDGRYVKDKYGNIVYTIDGNYIREGSSTYGNVKYTISGNCIYDGSRIAYSIHGSNVVKDTVQTWGIIAYTID